MDEREIAILNHQIAVADAAGPHPDQHFAVTRYRNSAVLKLEFGFRTT
jgi:hypothetical protein